MSILYRRICLLRGNALAAATIARKERTQKGSLERNRRSLTNRCSCPPRWALGKVLPRPGTSRCLDSESGRQLNSMLCGCRFGGAPSCRQFALMPKVIASRRMGNITLHEATASFDRGTSLSDRSWVGLCRGLVYRIL